jgi:hypothetical protein
MFEFLKRKKKIKSLEFEKKCLKNALDEACDDLYIAEREAEEYKTKFINSFCELPTKRVIIGKKGCGKTTFIKEAIIPKLKDYIVIDMCDEYKEVPAERKYIFHNDFSIKHNLDNVYEVLRLNKNCVFIIDDACLIGPDANFIDAFYVQKDVSVITSFPAIKSCGETIEYCDYIYLFDTMDSERIRVPFIHDHSDKIIFLEKDIRR